MERERKNKSLLIGVLCAVILFMAIGFAAIGAQLNITAGATISDTWNVQITGIVKKDSSAGVVETADPSFSATTANFNVSLKQPGDYAVYTVTVENSGTLDAVLSKITETVATGGSDAIEYTLTPAENSVQGSQLVKNTGVHTFDVKVEYLSTAVGTLAPTEGASKSYTLTLDYAQDISE